MSEYEDLLRSLLVERFQPAYRTTDSGVPSVAEASLTRLKQGLDAERPRKRSLPHVTTKRPRLKGGTP